MKLDIYRVVQGEDNWERVGTIEAVTAEECFAAAEKKYGQEEYHWTNPY